MTMNLFRSTLPALAAAALISACGGGSDGSSTPAVPGTVVTAAQMTDDQLNTILFKAKPGDTITLPAGKYTLNGPLMLNIDNVTIEGAGNGNDPTLDTILSFKGAATRDGVQVADVRGVTLRKFAVEDAAGNGIFVNKSTDVVMDTLRTEWTTDPVNTSEMAYGLYPVSSDNVLVINSKAIGTRDAGVYVGQSTNITVRNNEAYYNVAGIEIENSHNAVVEDNDVHDNTGGILVFALPGTYRFGDNNGTLVRNNKVHDNNQPVAATATGFVRAVPPGTGIMVLAAQNTEVTGNTIANHATSGVLLVSFQSTGIAFPSSYDPYLRAAYVHANSITGFGATPGGAFADPAGLKPVVDGLFAFLGGNSLPAQLPGVIWDGIVDPASGSGVGTMGEGGSYAGNLQVCSKGNTIDPALPNIPGVISYENMDLDLIGLMSGATAQPVFPFPPRLDCTITLPAVTGQP
jgi:parallel beta-helix repeat protein